MAAFAIAGLQSAGAIDRHRRTCRPAHVSARSRARRRAIIRAIIIARWRDHDAEPNLYWSGVGWVPRCVGRGGGLGGGGSSFCSGTCCGGGGGANVFSTTPPPAPSEAPCPA